MSLITCSLLGDRSLLKQNKKDRPSQRETRLLLLRSRAQRNTEMERTTLIISSSAPKHTKLLNLSNPPLEAMKFLPYFSVPQDHLQFLAQKPALFSGVNCLLFHSPGSEKAISLSAQRLGKPDSIGHSGKRGIHFAEYLGSTHLCLFQFKFCFCECGWPELYLR